MQNAFFKATDITFNPETFKGQFSLLFPTESLLEYFAEVDPNQIIEVSFKKGTAKLRRPKTQPQHNKWFAVLTEILLHHKRQEDPYAKVTAKDLLLFHREMKRQFFPCGQIKIGTLAIPSVPSINDLSVEELGEALSAIIQQYDYVTMTKEYPDEKISV